jgi:hypothetical protein
MWSFTSILPAQLHAVVLRHRENRDITFSISSKAKLCETQMELSVRWDDKTTSRMKTVEGRVIFRTVMCISVGNARRNCDVMKLVLPHASDLENCCRLQILVGLSVYRTLFSRCKESQRLKHSWMKSVKFNLPESNRRTSDYRALAV